MIAKVANFWYFSFDDILPSFSCLLCYHNEQVTKSHGKGFLKLLFLVLLPVQRLNSCTTSAQTCLCFQTT